MTKIFLDAADKHFQNLNQYDELVRKPKLYDGKSYVYHKYQDKHPRGLEFQIWRGFLAVLAMISVIGILFFRKQVLAMWNEARTGKQVYKVYQTAPDEEDPQTTKMEEIFKGHAVPKAKPETEKFVSDDELRIISRGLPKTPNITPGLIADINSILNSSSFQRTYVDKTKIGLIRLDILQKYFQKDVNESDLQGALRLMVLRGEAFFVAKGKNECSFLSRVPFNEHLAEQHHLEVVCDKLFLLYIDKFMSDHFLDISTFGIPANQMQLVKETIDQINAYSYTRATGSKQALVLNNAHPTSRQFLDLLVHKGIINSYNYAPTTYHLKFAKDDFHDLKSKFIYKEWRDKSVLEKEKQFKKENKITLTQEVVAEFSGKKDALSELISLLNQRAKPGPCQYYFTLPLLHYLDSAKFLKEKGIIYKHSELPIGPLTVWVKPEDMDISEISHLY